MSRLTDLRSPHLSVRPKGRIRPYNMVTVRMPPGMRETFDKLAAEVFADMTAADYCFTDALTAVFLSGMALAKEVAGADDSHPVKAPAPAATPRIMEPTP